MENNGDIFSCTISDVKFDFFTKQTKSLQTTCRLHIETSICKKGNLKTKLGRDLFTLKWTWKEGNEFSDFWTEDSQSTLNPSLYWQVAIYIIQYIIISPEIWYTSLVRDGVFMRTYLSPDTIQQFLHTMALINNNFPE